MQNRASMHETGGVSIGYMEPNAQVTRKSFIYAFLLHILDLDLISTLGLDGIKITTLPLGLPKLRMFTENCDPCFCFFLFYRTQYFVASIGEGKGVQA